MAEPTLDFSRLTVEERLDLIARIWGSLERDPPLSPEQLVELERRSRDVDANPEDGTDAAEVIARLRAQLR
jgi:putative addiction module component (TIGR02574 family)